MRRFPALELGRQALAFVLLLAFVAVTARAAETVPPGVLILHSNQRPLPAAILIEETLRAAVPEALKRPVELFSEYLDAEWSSVEAYGPEEADFLRHKYRSRNIEVIVAVVPTALQFASTYRDLMFPGVPVVHMLIPKDVLERITLPADIVGSGVDLDPTPTIALALRLHPDAKRIVAVLGSQERDRAWEARLRSAFARMDRRIDVDYLAGLPTAEVASRVAALPRDAVVFMPGHFADDRGKMLVPRKTVELIAKASAVPTYAPIDTYLGAGIVGGSMMPYEAQARQASATIVRLLDGAAPASIAPSVVASVPIVDWRQLRRWEIDERRLPDNAVVMFREPTAWDRYGREISLGIVLVLVQAALIAALLIQARSRRLAAAALEQSQKQMNMAARAARLSLWVWDATRDKVRAAVRSRHRYDPAEQPRALDLESVIESAHPADRRELRRAVERAVATGDELDVEYRVADADGAVRWVAARGRVEKPGSERLVGVALDITERKNAELHTAQDRTALRHMTRVSMIGQLSAAIAHQLNQPLAAILGNAEAAQTMLTREKVDLAELRAICKDIADEDQRASEVIRRLSALYKRGDMKLERIDVNALIRETLDLLRTELLIRNVEVTVELEPTLPAVEGGYVQLQQVVLNLVLNAADAMAGAARDDRKLAIRTRSSATDVLMQVVDSGPGIPPADLEHVFAPFWSTRSEGMGMGLAVCRSIVASHRGRITAHNNDVRGATFSVSLPVRTGPPA